MWSILSDVASVAALGISIAALFVALRAVRLDRRPIVRIVATVSTGYVFLGGSQHGSSSVPSKIQMHEVLLKNIGKGPGITVIAFDPEHAALMGVADVVEPLGPGDRESTRLGRVSLPLKPPMVINGSYELYYQDTLGAWHLTRFWPRTEKMECAFVGEVKKVPNEVRAQGTVAKA